MHVYTHTIHACIYTQMYIIHTCAHIHTHMHTYAFKREVCLSSQGFCPGVLSGVLSGRFCSGWFLSVPSSVRIHPLQQKVKHHFQWFHMYDKKIKSVTSHAFDPSVTKIG